MVQLAIGLSALACVLDGLALLTAFLMLLGPRGSDKDLYPAAAVYALAVIAGLAGLVLGWRAHRRSAKPDRLTRQAMELAGISLAFGPACALLGWMLCAQQETTNKRDTAERAARNAADSAATAAPSTSSD